MPTIPLTDARIRGLKATGASVKVSDGGGLYLMVTPQGSKLWRLAYRFAGKQKTLAIGVYPTVSLVDARLARETAKKALADGVDPGEEKKAKKRERNAAVENTFQAVAERWYAARKVRWTTPYGDRLWKRLEEFVFPELGDRPVIEIEPPELLKALRKVEARGTLELSHRLKSYCGQVFRYAIAEGIGLRDPSADIREALKAQPPVKHRSALKATELPEFFSRLAAYDGAEQTALGLRLVMLTMVRVDEARFAPKAEFEALDGKEPLWRIPKERMKMRRDHLVPLTPQAVKVVRRLIEISPKPQSPLLFASDAAPSGVMSENTLLYALYRMGYHHRATVHGFRSTASTVLNEQGFNRDWIERQLAHVEGNAVRGIYNAAEWLKERRSMLAWWADYLDRQAEAGELIG